MRAMVLALALVACSGPALESAPAEPWRAFEPVRRINAVKRLMIDGYTIEEIQAQFLQYTDLVEGIDESLTELFARLETELAGAREATASRGRGLGKDVADARRFAEDLMRRLEDIARRATAPRADRIRRSGAAGSAEDLL